MTSLWSWPDLVILEGPMLRGGFTVKTVENSKILSGLADPKHQPKAWFEKKHTPQRKKKHGTWKNDPCFQRNIIFQTFHHLFWASQISFRFRVVGLTGAIGTFPSSRHSSGQLLLCGVLATNRKPHLEWCILQFEPMIADVPPSFLHTYIYTWYLSDIWYLRQFFFSGYIVTISHIRRLF